MIGQLLNRFEFTGYEQNKSANRSREGQELAGVENGSQDHPERPQTNIANVNHKEQHDVAVEESREAALGSGLLDFNRTLKWKESGIVAAQLKKSQKIEHQKYDQKAKHEASWVRSAPPGA